jgi:hypothetical protein
LSQHAGTTVPSGVLGFEVIRGIGTEYASEAKFRDIIRDGLPSRDATDEVNEYRVRNSRNLLRGAKRVAAARALGIPHFYGAVTAKVLKGDGSEVDLGLVSLRVVTTAGVNRIVAGLQANTTDLSLWRFHGFGTGGTAEAVGDTALVTELTTEYAVANTRPTGSQTTGGGSNVYRTVATLSPSGSGNINITEHGIFTQAATGGGVLLDRSLFTAVGLTRGSDSLQVTYDLTVNAGG